MLFVEDVLVVTVSSSITSSSVVDGDVSVAVSPEVVVVMEEEEVVEEYVL